MCLIYSDETVEASEQDWQQTMDEYTAFGKAATEAGVVRGGDALRPTTGATTMKLRKDAILTHHVPCAETNEHLGGDYELDCTDLHAAIQRASNIPRASAR